MSKKNVSRKAEEVKRARLSMDRLDAQEIADELAQPGMFNNGEDLPLFSGTPQTVPASAFTPQAENTQARLAACPTCLDTGIVRVRGKDVKCFCGIADENATRAILIAGHSMRLQKVRQHSPAAYAQPGDDIEKMLKDASAIQSPYERIFQQGTSLQSVTDLLTIVLDEQTPILASRLIVKYETIARMYHTSNLDLASMKGMTSRRVVKLKAALALGYQFIQERKERPSIKAPGDAANLVGPDMTALDHEEMRIVMLDVKNRVLGIHLAYVGSLHTTVIRVGDIFKEPVKVSAAAIVVVHNHPSGDPTPSPEDVAVTSEFIKAGKLLDIDVLDHIVIGEGARFVSLKERGLGFLQ